jgi:hypothetical protein
MRGLNLEVEHRGLTAPLAPLLIISIIYLLHFGQLHHLEVEQVGTWSTYTPAAPLATIFEAAIFEADNPARPSNLT